MQFLGRGGANVLSIMWFGTLWLLGIDSMFAMVEGVATVITDTPRFCHLKKEKVALWTCILGFLGSLVFVSDIGFYLLDAFDHYSAALKFAWLTSYAGCLALCCLQLIVATPACWPHLPSCCFCLSSLSLRTSNTLSPGEQ
jgi:SNF family Na+-dependent transporter